MGIFVIMLNRMCGGGGEKMIVKYYFPKLKKKHIFAVLFYELILQQLI